MERWILEFRVLGIDNLIELGLLAYIKHLKPGKRSDYKGKKYRQKCHIHHFFIFLSFIIEK